MPATMLRVSFSGLFAVLVVHTCPAIGAAQNCPVGLRLGGSGSVSVSGFECPAPRNASFHLGCPESTAQCAVQCGGTGRTLRATGSLTASGVPCQPDQSPRPFANVSVVEASVRATINIGNGCSATATGGISFEIINDEAEPIGFNISVDRTLSADGDVRFQSDRSFVRVVANGGILCAGNCNNLGGEQNTLITSGTLNPGLSLTIGVQSHCEIGAGDGGPGDPSSANGEASMRLTITFSSQAGGPLGDQIFSWANPAGGSYDTPANWEPACNAPPVHGDQRSDTARFGLPTGAFIPVTGSGATAGRWLVDNSQIDFQGSGEVFGPNPFLFALDVSNGGKLRLSNGATLTTPKTHIGGTGGEDPGLEIVSSGVGFQPGLINTGLLVVGRGLLEAHSGGRARISDLDIGTGDGLATVRVRQQSSELQISGLARVGRDGPGILEVLEGGLFNGSSSGSENVVIGESGEGTVTVRGSDPAGNDVDTTRFAILTLLRGLTVGQGAKGTLNVERGGLARVNSLEVPPPGAAGSGEVRVSGQGGRAMLNVFETLSVGATELIEVDVQAGGTLATKKLTLGSSQIRPGTAEMTVRGRGSVPSQLVVEDIDLNCCAGTVVGDTAPGQLKIQDGAFALFNGGSLEMGSGARGLVLISGQNAPPGEATEAISNGEVKVGTGAEGVLQLTHGAKMTHTGEFKIGLGAGVPSGSVSLDVNSLLDVNGRLSVGPGGDGLLELKGGSRVECETLLVGGSGSPPRGTITLSEFSFLKINGNAQVATSAGELGVIALLDASVVLSVDGTMTIGNGNPGGGPGFGSVGLVDARIEGIGNIVVQANGSLTGTGIVDIPKTLLSGGVISPGLSPGKITIGGEYEQTEAGTLVIEIAGLDEGRFDVLSVTGNAALGGTLEVRFLDGFLPATGNGVDFLEVGGEVNGSFAQITFPQLAPGFDADLTLADGKLRLTARTDGAAGEGTSLTPPAELTTQSAAPPAMACGAGTCGAGGASMLPLMMCGLAGMRRSQR